MANNKIFFDNFYAREKRLYNLYQEAKKMQNEYFVSLQQLGLIEENATYTNALLKKGLSKLFNTEKDIGLNEAKDLKTKDNGVSNEAMSIIQKDINELVMSSVTDSLSTNGLYMLKQKMDSDIKNKENDNIIFGDLLEYIRTSQLTSGIENLFKDKGFKVINTSPKEFGESIKYDIRLEIPDMNNTAIDKGKKNKLLSSIRFEVKSGTKGFKLGRVSGNTILESLNNKQGLEYYKSLSNYIDQVIEEYTIDYGIDDSNGYIEYPIVFANYTAEELYYEIGVNYVTWRLDNNFPIFLRGTSSTINNPGNQILLCTEFIWNLGHNIGMEVDVDTAEDYVILDIKGDNPEQIKRDAMDKYKDLMYKNITMMTVFYGKS